MQLRGINFRPVANAAGAQGFFGEGYWYHPWAKWIGLTFRNCGFVAKTTTFDPRRGNMLLQADEMTPQDKFPMCIVVKPIQGVALNAVGLSGPGALALLSDGRWQRRTDDPFFLSFMAVQKTPGDRLDELKGFVQLLKQHRGSFRTQIGLELNVSCPNTGLSPELLVSEVGQALDTAAELDIPLQPKFNVLVSAQTVCDIARHSACDAVTMSNTIPWGKLSHRIDWKRLFGSDTSPLTRFGGGGLSGWPLLPIVCEKIGQMRDCGLRKPIWACGGIDSARAVKQAHQAGASGVQFATASMIRPWQTPRIIAKANKLFS